MMSVYLERLALFYDFFENFFKQFLKLAVVHDGVGIACVSRAITYMPHYIVAVFYVKAFEHLFEIQRIRPVFGIFIEYHREIHVISFHKVHGVYNDVKRILFDYFNVVFACRLVVACLYTESEIKIFVLFLGYLVFYFFIFFKISGEL